METTVSIKDEPALSSEIIEKMASDLRRLKSSKYRLSLSDDHVPELGEGMAEFEKIVDEQLPSLMP